MLKDWDEGGYISCYAVLTRDVLSIYSAEDGHIDGDRYVGGGVHASDGR